MELFKKPCVNLKRKYRKSGENFISAILHFSPSFLPRYHIAQSASTNHGLVR
jgi:hypothetical protein